MSENQTPINENNEQKKIFLLDAFALIYRSYFAFIKNPRINSNGLNTSASFGFTNTLIELLKKEKPSHIAVVFDPPEPTFRHKIFPFFSRSGPVEAISLEIRCLVAIHRNCDYTVLLAPTTSVWGNFLNRYTSSFWNLLFWL